MSERLLGEGIYFAVKSGQEAAFSIVESFKTCTDLQKLYWHRLSEIRTDLRLCHLSSKIFYNWPRISLKALSMPFFHTRFVNGYAAGKPLSQIFYKN
jgi:flavin-dependent dehydrogenase